MDLEEYADKLDEFNEKLDDTLDSMDRLSTLAIENMNLKEELKKSKEGLPMLELNAESTSSEFKKGWAAAKKHAQKQKDNLGD